MVSTSSIASLLVLGLLIGLVAAECPSEHDIPVMYDSTRYLGCYYYPQGNAETAIQSCIGEFNEYHESSDYTPDDPSLSLYDHALVIRPGCIVYEFSEPEYQGSVTEFSAGVHPNVLSRHERFSFKVRCDIDHINCQPSDGYVTVLLCDALGAVVDTDCTYMKTIGTTYTESISESMSLDTSLAAEMSATFFGLFSAGLSVSVETGYDWNHVSQTTQGVTESFEVSATAPAGYVLTIEQAVGHCGDSDVNTEMFRITQKSRDGVSTVKYVTAARDSAPLQ